jgi:hypothetical protein
MDYIPYSTVNEVEVSGQAKPLQKICNGLQLYIPINEWATYQNLPNYLLNGIATTSVNNGNITVTINKRTTVYLLRAISGWWEIDLTGWTLYSTGDFIKGVITMNVYIRELNVGVYTFNDSSAMYIFTSQLPIKYEKHLENGIINIEYKYKILKKENEELKERMNEIEEQMKILLKRSRFM